MSRKNVRGRWIGLAFVAALVVTSPAGAAGFAPRGTVPSTPSVWSQVWAWVLGGLQQTGGPISPFLTAAFAEVGMHIDPNGTEPTLDPSGAGGNSLDSVNISVTVDPGQ